MHQRLVAAVLSLARLAGVVLVLLGIVAMHQLAGGAHMAATHGSSSTSAPTAGVTHAAPAAAEPAMSAVRVPASGGSGMPATHSMAGALATVEPLRAVVAGARPHPAARSATATTSATAAAALSSHGAMPLCLAVLTGLLIVLLPTAVHPALRVAVPATTARAGTSPPGRGPPRALLAQICVLRT